MNKLKLNVSDLDYTKIERPVEPAFENEDPEGWCEVLAWEEARADKLEKENAELKEALERSNFAFQANLARANVKCERSMLEALERNNKLLNK